MKLLLFLSEITIPLLIFCIVGYGLLNRQPVYEEFVEGAKDGFWTVIKIMPTLIGLMVAVGVLRASGLLDCIAQGLGQITAEIGFPAELFPVTIVKMFSSSAATGLLLDIYKEYGADSTLGKMASVMMSSTETIFYTMSVYFMSVKVKKTRYTLAGALLATVAGTIASVVIVSYMKQCLWNLRKPLMLEMSAANLTIMRNETIIHLCMERKYTVHSEKYRGMEQSGSSSGS